MSNIEGVCAKTNTIERVIKKGKYLSLLVDHSENIP